jgi:hypothetical protein
MNKTNSLNVLVSDRDALVAVTSPLTGWAHGAEEVAKVAEVAPVARERFEAKGTTQPRSRRRKDAP